jgi:mRNA-degrading endonuclease RelE of RelBE toxin-antitoxin system
MAADKDAPAGERSVEISLSESLYDDLEGSWESLGYASREALLESVLVDAIEHPEFDRGDLRAMLTAEVEIQDGQTHSSAEITAEVGTDRPDVDSNDWDWLLTDTAKADLDRRDDYARERIVSQLDEIVSGEWRNPTEDLDALADSPHDKLLVGPFRLGCRVDHDEKLLYVLRIRMRGS